MTSSRSAPRLAPLVAFALAACAHAGTGAAPRAELAGAEPPPAVAVTGSRVPQRPDAATGRAASGAPVKVYTAEELRRGGQRDLGQALRALDVDAH